MLNRNSKLPGQKENSYQEERHPQFMKNSSVVDKLVESMQNSTARRQPSDQSSRPDDIFKFVSSHLNNSEMENSQRSNAQQPPLAPFKKQTSEEDRRDRSFKKRSSNDGDGYALRTEVADALMLTEKQMLAQVKKQQQRLSEETKQYIDQCLKRVVAQLNTKLLSTDKVLAKLGDENIVAVSGLELLKQQTAKQIEEIVARLDSQHQDKL